MRIVAQFFSDNFAYFITLLVVLAFILHYARIKPIVSNDHRAKLIVEEAFNGTEFRDIVISQCVASEEQICLLGDIIRENMLVGFSLFIKGGYATRDENGLYIIVIPSFIACPNLIHHCSAVHELLHHVRNIQGACTFAKENSFGFIRGLPFRSREEVHIWIKTILADGMGSFFTLLAYIITYPTISLFVYLIVSTIQKNF